MFPRYFLTVSDISGSLSLRNAISIQLLPSVDPCLNFCLQFFDSILTIIKEVRAPW